MKLHRRLCAGCGRVWHARQGGCTACGYESPTPPRVGDLLAGTVPAAWVDVAGLVRGVARALGLQALLGRRTVRRDGPGRWAGDSLVVLRSEDGRVTFSGQVGGKSVAGELANVAGELLCVARDLGDDAGGGDHG